MTEPTPAPRPIDQAELLKRRKRRNIAIGLVLTALVVIFYVLTIAKLGPGILNREL